MYRLYADRISLVSFQEEDLPIGRSQSPIANHLATYLLRREGPVSSKPSRLRFSSTICWDGQFAGRMASRHSVAGHIGLLGLFGAANLQVFHSITMRSTIKASFDLHHLWHFAVISSEFAPSYQTIVRQQLVMQARLNWLTLSKCCVAWYWFSCS